MPSPGEQFTSIAMHDASRRGSKVQNPPRVRLRRGLETKTGGPCALQASAGTSKHRLYTRSQSTQESDKAAKWCEDLKKNARGLVVCQRTERGETSNAGAGASSGLTPGCSFLRRRRNGSLSSCHLVREPWFSPEKQRCPLSSSACR